MSTKPDFDHWWESASYRKKAARLSGESRWQMEEAAAFVYELVRRLSLTRAELSDKERNLIFKLPKFTTLHETAKGIIGHELWSSWKVRPIAYDGALPEWLEGYYQPSFFLDLAASFAAITEFLKSWYEAERKRRRIKSLKGVRDFPFRVTWDRVALLEKPQGGVNSRPRERALELAKQNVGAVISGWESCKQWKWLMKPLPTGVFLVHHVLPVPIWKKINLSARLRPSRYTDSGMAVVRPGRPSRD